MELSITMNFGTLRTLIIMLMVVICISPSLARERQTMGRSGDLCESGTRRCLTRKADCQEETCVCRGGMQGDGNFACYAEDEAQTEVKNDPTVKTTTEESYDLPFPCRYLLTHFSTVFTGYKNSTCEVKVQPFNAKNKGKVYVYGLDISLRISTPISSPPTGDISYRIYGQAQQGRYTFTEMAVKEFYPDGPWPLSDFTTIYMPMTHVYTRYDHFNNLMKFDVETCGFEITFRPNDIVLNRAQLQVPGVSVRVKDEKATVWLSQHRVLGLRPNGPTVSDIAESLGMDRRFAMALRMFKADVAQVQPDPAEACSALPRTLQRCADISAKRDAFSTCWFLLELPTFIRCYDNSDNGEGILELFNQCILASCNRSRESCDSVKQEVRTCVSVNKTEVYNFLEKDC